MTDSSVPLELIASKFRFLVSCTKGSVAQANLAVNAKALVDRLELPVKGLSSQMQTEGKGIRERFFVPSLDFGVYLKEIEDKFKVADELETSIKTNIMYDKLKELSQSSNENMFEGFDLILKSSSGPNTIADDEGKAIAAINSFHAKKADMLVSSTHFSHKHTLETELYAINMARLGPHSPNSDFADCPRNMTKRPKMHRRRSISSWTSMQ